MEENNSNIMNSPSNENFKTSNNMPPNQVNNSTSPPKASDNKLYIILGIVLVILLIALVTLIIYKKNVSNQSTPLNTTRPVADNNGGTYCVGTDGDYLYLIDENMETKKIYKFSTYYSSDYIVRDGRIFIIYTEMGGNTKYVDVINIATNEKDKITIDEITQNTYNKDYDIYYINKYKITVKNHVTGQEELDLSEKTNENYYYETKDHKLIRTNLSTNEEEILFTYKESSYDFIVGKEKIYHCGDDNFYCYNLKTKTNEIIGPDRNSVEGHGVKGMIVECDTTSYVYTNQHSVLIINGDTNTKESIFSVEDDGEVSNVSMITPNILQISVMHLGNHNTHGTFWADDEWHYYNIQTKQFINSPLEKGLSKLILFNVDNVSIDPLEGAEEAKNETNDDTSSDIAAIEQNKSICQNRILNNLKTNYSEDDILKLLSISKSDYNSYKQSFIGSNSDSAFQSTEELKTKHKELAERNFQVIENYILLSDDNTSQYLYAYISSAINSKYNIIYARVLSGMLNYYFPKNTNSKSIKFLNISSVMIGGYEMALAIDSNYVLSYGFGSDKYDQYSLLVYEGTTSFDDVYNNYEEYEDDQHTYINLMVMSYDFLGYWESLTSMYGG